MKHLLCICQTGRTRQDGLGLPSPLARYGVAQAKDGRKVGGHLNCKDVLSEHCQRRKHLTIERLDKFDAEADAWEEILVEDQHAGPADVAVSRIDFAAWLRPCRADFRSLSKARTVPSSPDLMRIASIQRHTDDVGGRSQPRRNKTTVSEPTTQSPPTGESP